MQPRVNIITLGVKDIDRSRQFYVSGLGWKASSASNQDIVFIPLLSVVLSLYQEKLLAEDATVEYSSPAFRGITLAHNVSSKEEVDKVLSDAVTAGAKLVKPAQDVFWGGYSGYFADLDGHLWEVAFNPFWPIQEDGQLEIPK